MLIILGSGEGSGTLWVIDLGFVGINVQEARGVVHGFPQTGDGLEFQAAETRYLEKRISREDTQLSGNTDTGDVHLQAAGDIGRVGGVEADT